MVVVHYYDNKNRILTRYLDHAPTEGSDVRIKGRSGKVTKVQTEDNHIYNVQVELQPVAKNKQVGPALPQSKKRR
ncbi:hypothetical protein [Bacillus sp. EB01]|uniref:hypothetical protein n=1 Tax=Bacillus sp. EB01 TaxID=1347086 RepID=UPI0005C661EB|nr:hypothetical protein [Bacillus sp. EB01]